jgi:uncharacterized protein YpbB
MLIKKPLKIKPKKLFHIQAGKRSIQKITQSNLLETSSVQHHLGQISLILQVPSESPVADHTFGKK